MFFSIFVKFSSQDLKGLRNLYLRGYKDAGDKKEKMLMTNNFILLYYNIVLKSHLPRSFQCAMNLMIGYDVFLFFICFAIGTFFISFAESLFYNDVFLDLSKLVKPKCKRRQNINLS